MLLSSLAVEKIARGYIAWIRPQHGIVDVVAFDRLVIVRGFFLRMLIVGVGSSVCF